MLTLRKTTKVKCVTASTKPNVPSTNNALIYEATINSNLQNYKEKYYIGLCETSFKLRYANHKKSFIHEKYKENTELSKEFWSIKQQLGTPALTWKILKNVHKTNNNATRCTLCLQEKTIILYNQQNILNKRNEIISTCRHRNKYKLSHFNSND